MRVLPCIDRQKGLVVTNITRGMRLTIPGYSFKSSPKWEEILVFCLSGSFNDHLHEQFGAVTCVEINDIAAFCKRVEVALPPGASFPETRGRTRIGCWIEYYDEGEGGSPRWALPERIATAKPKRYSWQNEFRLVFSLTDALAFENVGTRLVHQECMDSLSFEAQALRDISQLHGF
jgi:hypothetical protein